MARRLLNGALLLSVRDDDAAVAPNTGPLLAHEGGVTRAPKAPPGASRGATVTRPEGSAGEQRARYEPIVPSPAGEGSNRIVSARASERRAHISA